ncbi:hypothetical protein ACQEU5_08965 [Marinactinospora thermotolerans]|nr:hypothetical protein [Marinactinospora thermotolerans]
MSTMVGMPLMSGNATTTGPERPRALVPVPRTMTAGALPPRPPDG